jgi:prepilin-type N-terminal cleavage/methylation domain-containing protein
MSHSSASNRGFTLAELLISSTIMAVIVLGALSVYMQSNRIAVDQQEFAGLQNDVRSGMFFISRDIKNLGAGLPQQFAGYFLSGVNNDPNQSNETVQSDRLTILGNSDPLRLVIDSYNPGDLSNTIFLKPDHFKLYPYTENVYPADIMGYVNRLILILPNPDLNTQNGELGYITGVDFIFNTITFTRINLSLPNALAPGGAVDHYVGGTVHFVELKTYWLDVSGNYPDLTPGQNGYSAQPGVLYVSRWNEKTHVLEHQAIAQNIEDLQFQYHGDFDSDSMMDTCDFLNWDESFVMTDNPAVVDGIRRVRILILGRTDNPYLSVSNDIPSELRYVYGRPPLADSPAPLSEDLDRHKRFLIESIVNIRSMSLNIYNSGII